MVLFSLISFSLLMYSVGFTAGICSIDRNCPLGKFYNGTTGSCVDTCYPNHGNSTTGECTEVQAGVEAWLDATVYEVFILPTVQFNQTILHLNLSLTNDFLYQVDYNDYHVEDISFHLHSAYSFFYLANQNTSHTTFLNYFGVLLPDTVESTELISAVDDRIPLNDYNMRLEVTAGDRSLLYSDIVIHVVEPLPVLPHPGACVELLYSSYSALESDELISITLVLTGEPQKVPVNVTIIASVNNEMSPSATDEDFIAGRYDVTILPGTTRAVVNIPLLLDKIVEGIEYFMIHLYIPSATYELGIQQGSIINAVASIIDIGIYSSTSFFHTITETKTIMSTSYILSTTSTHASSRFTTADPISYTSAPVASSALVSTSMPLQTTTVSTSKVSTSVSVINPTATPIIKGAVMFTSSVYMADLDDDNNEFTSSADMGSSSYESVELTLSHPLAETITVYISILNEDLIELDTLVALFHPGDVVFEINPVHLLSNYSVPVDINFVVLIIKPFVSTILTLGDISETKVIFKGRTVVEWTSSVYRGYENDGFVVAAISISAPYSSIFNITINPYELSSGLVSNLSSTVALGNDIDFQSEPFNVTVPKYSTNITVNIPIYSDRILSYKKAFGLRFYFPKSVKIRSGHQSESIAEILNTDILGVRFDKNSQGITEGDVADVLIRADRIAVEDIYFTLHITALTASVNDYYYNNSLSAVLVAGHLNTSVDIPAVDDNIVELNESMIIRIEQVLTATSLLNFVEVLQPNSTLIEIIDSDETYVSLAADQYAVTEGDDIEIGIEMDKELSFSETIYIMVAPSSNTSSTATVDDYSTDQLTVTISPGLRNTSVRLNITDDDMLELLESLNISIIIPEDVIDKGIYPGNIISAVVYITDNDETSVSLSSSVYIVHENYDQVTILVTSSRVTPTEYEVELHVTTGSASAVDFNTSSVIPVLFKANVTEVTVNITIVNDEELEHTEEFNIQLVIADDVHDIGVNEGSITSAVVEIVDDDTVAVQFTQEVFSVYENESELVITLDVSRPALIEFSIIILASPDTADESDFDPGNTTVTFGPMDMYTNFTIKINDDNLLETAEKFNLSLVIPDITKDRGVEEGAPASAIARILNDDRVQVSWSSSMITVTEGNDISVSLLLDREPGLELILTINTTNFSTSGYDYRVSPYMVMFGSHERQKDFNISARLDMMLELNETFILYFGITSDAKAIGVVEGFPSVVNVTILNNDSVSVRFAELHYNVTEGSDVMIAILSDKPANKDFSVFLTTFTTQSTTAASINDFANVTSEVKFGANQTEAFVLIHAQEDLILETNEEFIVQLELMEEDRMVGVQLSEHYDSATVTIINKNAIHVGLTAMEYFTIEDSGVMSVVLESDQPANTSITVALKLTANTASEMDFSIDDIVVVFGPTDTQVIANITIISDRYPEVNETFLISLIIPPDVKEIGVRSGRITNATGVILNDDRYYVSFAENVVDVIEGNSRGVEIVLDHATGINVSVMVIANPLTATEADYFILQSTVSFGPNDRSENVTVFTIDDNIVEFQELFSLSIKISDELKDVGVIPRNINTVMNIIDNDSMGVRFYQASQSVTEGDIVTILITADHITVQNVSIILQLASLTASVNDYYYNNSLSAILVAGQLNTSVDISIVDDNIVELNESMIIRIEQVLTTQDILIEVIQPNSTFIEIIDNDETYVSFVADQYGVTEGDDIEISIEMDKELSFSETIYIMVAPSNNASSTATVDDYSTDQLVVTISPGLRNTAVRLNITDDNMLELVESLNISIIIPEDVIDKGIYPGNITSAVVNITDNDETSVSLSSSVYIVHENYDQVTILVTSSRVTPTEYEVELHVTTGSASAVDFNTSSVIPVLFKANVTEVTVNITIVNDEELEHTEEFNIQLVIADDVHDIGVNEGSITSAVVEIVDDDTVAVQFTQEVFSVYENESELVITLDVSRPALIEFSVIILASPDTADESDFDPGNTTVTFGSMDMCTNFTIKINDDNLLETAEKFNLSLVIPDITKDRGVEEGAPASAIARILNDDRVQVSWSSSMITVTEGNDISVSLLLDREPGLELILTINTTDFNTSGFDYRVSPYMVMFGSNERQKDINISARLDMMLELNEIFMLYFEITSDAKSIGVVEGFPSVVNVAILNNDSVSVRFAELHYNVTEGSDVMIAILSDKPANKDFSVFLTTFTTQSTTAASINDFANITSEVKFGANQTEAFVLIHAQEDLILETNEDFIVQLELMEEDRMVGVRVNEQYDSATVTIINKNAIYVGLTAMEYFTIEDSGVMSIVLESDQPANTSIAVTLKLTANSASEMDFSSDDIDVVFGPTDTQVVANITITADRYPEVNETFLISLIIPPDVKEIGVRSGRITNATGVILNDDRYYVSFAENVVDVIEGNSRGVEIVLDHATGINVSVMVTANPLTATEADYFILQSTVNFGPNDRCKNVTVFTIDDDIVEFQELFSLSIKISDELKDVGVIPRNINTVMNIIDNDIFGVRFDEASESVTEGDIVTILITADRITVQNVSIILQLVSLTASVNDYYYNNSLGAVLVAGQLNTSVDITTMDDNIVELNESMIIRIEQVLTTQDILIEVIQPNSTLIEIIDNDETYVSFAADQYAVTEGDDIEIGIEMDKELSFSETIYIMVAPSSNTSSTATVDDYNTDQLVVTISPGLRNTSVRLNITDDDMLELVESLNISIIVPEDVINKDIYPGNITSAVVHITDNDETSVSLSSSVYIVHENYDQVTILVTSSRVTSTEYEVELHVTTGSASAADFNSSSVIPVLFKANVTEVTVNITIVNDEELEHTEEFNIQLVIADDVHDIGVNEGSITSAVVEIVDDDTVAVQFTQEVFSVYENESELVITLDVSRPALIEFSVIILVSPDTADESDFEPGNMTVTFGSMDMYTNFTIKINDDNLLETAEQFNLSVVIPDITKDRGVEEGAPASAIARILNDDRVQVSWSSSMITVTEGNDISVSLLLDREPGVELILTINTTDFSTSGYDYRVSPYVVVFESNERQKDINISARLDMMLELNETFMLYFEITSDAKAIGVVEGSLSVINVTILNNDSVSVRFAELHYNVTEGSDVMIAILSDKPANKDFSVMLTTLTTQSTTAASINDFANVTSEVKFGANQTKAFVLIHAQEDLILETNEEFIVQLKLMEEDRMIGVQLNEHYDSATVTIINKNAIHVGLTAMEYFTIEDSGVMSVVLESDQPANTSITVTLKLTANTASEMDFSSDDIDVVFGPTDTQVVANITITADRYPEVNEMFLISLIIPPDVKEIGVRSGRITNATGVILNDDRYYVSFAENVVDVIEGNSRGVEIVINHATGINVSVMVTANPLTATEADYFILRSTVNFGPNDRSKNVTVFTIDDNIVEFQELFSLSIKISDELKDIGVIPRNINTVMNIIDNDILGVRFDEASESVTEGDIVTILITADHITVQNVSIILQLASLTASVNDYYNNNSLSAILVAGQLNTSVDITTLDDNIVELNESMIIRIEQVLTTQDILIEVIQPNSTLIEIIDNDETYVSFVADQYAVTEGDDIEIGIEMDKELSFSETIYIMVAPSSNTSSTATVDDYSTDQLTVIISPGLRNTTVRLNITDDDMLELVESFNISIIVSEDVIDKDIYPGNITSAVVHITDNDETFVSLSSSVYIVHENYDQVTILVTSSRVTSTEYKVELHVTTGSASAADFNSSSVIPVLFKANVTEVTVNITIVNDEELEHTEEFNIQLVIAEDVHDIGVNEGSITSAVVEIVDDDTVAVQFTQEVFSVYENESELVITLDVSRPALIEFSVIILVSPDTADESDFEPGNMTVTFGSMDMYTNFTIKINDDNLLETAEKFNLSLVIPDITKDRGVEEGAPASAIARILNDDRVQVSWSSSMITVTEGNDISVSLLLDREPGLELILTINTTDFSTSGYDYRVSPYVVVFGSNERQKDINISARLDMMLELNETFMLYFEITSDAKAIGVVEGSLSVINVTILNNDSVSVRFAELHYNVTEGSDVMIVILSDKPANKDFSVLLTTFTTQSTTAASINDFANVTSEVKFGANQTEAFVLIHAQEDLILETNEEFIVQLELMEEDRMIGVQLSEHYGSATVTIINKNAIHVGLTAMEYFTIEDSGVMSIVLESDQPANTSVTVALKLTANTASEMDFSSDDIDVVFGPTDTQVVVSITITADRYPEVNETFLISVIILPNVKEIGVRSGRITNATGVILNDDRYYVSFAENVVDVIEGNSRGVEIVLDHATGINVSVMVTANPLTATEADYFILQSTVSFGPNDRSKNVTVFTIDDNIVEFQELFSLSIKISDELKDVGVIPSNINTVMNIIDNDTLGLRFDQASQSVTEGDIVTILITGDHITVQNVSIILQLASLTASVNDYYNNNSLSAVLIAGQLNTSVDITTMDDNIVELNESMIIRIEQVLMTQDILIEVIQPNSTLIEIIDNDETYVSFVADQYAVTEGDDIEIGVEMDKELSFSETIYIMVAPSSNILSTATVDDYNTDQLAVTISPGLRNTTVRLNITDDDMLELVESLNISIIVPEDVINKDIYPGNITSAVVRITDNDETSVSLSSSVYIVHENYDQVTILVTSSKVTSTEYEIELHVTTGSASAVDFNISSVIPVLFKANVTEVTVNITIVNDEELEHTEEFNIQLVIADDVHDIGVNEGSITSAVVEIVDDDTVAVQFTQQVFSVYENESELVITLDVSRPALIEFSVIIVVLPDTASGSDFESSNTTVTFGPTDRYANFTVAINDDSLLEITEQFNLTLLIPDITKSTGVQEGAPVFAIARILNDDRVQVSWSTDTLVVMEGDNVSINLLLDREPDVNLMIMISTTDLNTREYYDYTVSPYLVVFGSDDMQKVVNISARLDMMLELNETFMLHFEIASDAKQIGVVEGSPSIAIVNILNNDSISLRLAELNYSVTEGSDVKVVILADKPSINRKFVVTLNTLTTRSTNAAFVVDFVNTTFEVEFGPNQTEAFVLIHAQEDLILETNEEFIVQLELMEEDRMIGVQLSEHYDSATVTIINKNAIHVGLTAMEYFTIEDSGVMSVVLESDQPANTSITVTLKLTANTASEMDFSIDDIDVVFGPTDTLVVANITIISDRYPEVNETFLITVIIPLGMKEIGVNNGTIINATGVILNDDESHIGFSKSSITLIEGNAVDLLVTLDNAVGFSFSVIIFSTPLTAIESDYSISPSVIMFGPNDTSKRIAILAADDDALEYNESLTVGFNNTNQLLDMGILVEGYLSVVIVDDDELQVFLDDDIYTVEEHQSVLPITIIAERPAFVSYNVLIHPVLNDSNATRSDFNTSLLVAHFGPNDTTSTVNIIITNDLELEPREAFKIMLSLPDNSLELGIQMGEPNSSIVVILDDDKLNVFFRHLRFTALESSMVISAIIEASKPAGIAFNVTVVPRRVNISELAASDEDFDSSQILLASFGPADTMITVNVSIFEDHLVENDEMFQLLINLPSSAEMLGIAKGTPHITDVVIIDDDIASVMFDRHSYNSSEGDGALIVTLISSLAADFPFAINVIPIRLTTESSNTLPNTTKVTFKAREFVASSNISIIDDNVLEYAEVFNLTLSIPDEYVTMGLMLDETATALATIYDNDEVTVSFSSQEYYAIEGQVIIIEVEASKAAGRLYGIYIVIPENNFTRTRYSNPNPILVRFGPSDVHQQFELQFSNNTLVDAPTELNIMLSIPDNASLLGIMLGAQQSAVITLVDNVVIEVNFTKDVYIVPNKLKTNSCVESEDGLSLPPLIQVQLNKPASVVVSLVVTVNKQGTQNQSIDVLANFPAGDTVWTMDNMILLRLGYDRLVLSIQLSENSVNIAKSFPHNVNATVETLHPIINLIDHVPKKVVAKHNSIMLMCFAHGRSTVSYYWERHSNSTDNWTKISAEMDTGLFILSSVTEEDEGIYRCVACDCYSCSYSMNTTTVIVYDQPSVSVQSQVIKLEHTSFNLTCTANIDPDSPNNLASLVWRNDNGSILARYNNKFGVLSFMNAHRSMSGIYECIVSDGTYNYSDTSNLFIQYGPKVTNISSVSILITDQPLVLVCEAHGDPLPSYTWYHNGISISHSSVYSKSNITTEDSGSYMCVVTNRAAGIPMNDSRTTNVTVVSITSLNSPRGFRHIQDGNYNVSFFWEDPVLPNIIQLTGFVLFYNVTDAFNRTLSEFIAISPNDNFYDFNKACSYESGLALCPSSQYCFELRGAYRRNKVSSLTIPSDKICLTTPEYLLYVSLVETNYNITEGTKLNIKIAASRAFSTSFKIYIIPKLVNATADDFKITTSEIIFDSASDQEIMFTVDIIDDIRYEPHTSIFNISIVLDDTAKPLGAILGDNSTATISIIDNDKFRECDAEIDSEWSLQWNKTKPKNDVVQECPGEFPIGMSSRLCDYGGIWEQPNVSTCVTKKFVELKNKTETLNITDVKNVTDIIDQLANITKPSNQSQLPLDISVAVEVLETVINRLNATNEETLEETLEEEDGLVDNAVEVFSNLLNETNKAGWDSQAQEGELVGETLLESAEEFGIIISSTLTKNTSAINSTREPNIEKENVVVQTVQLAKEEITKVESSGFISFLNDTNYSTFQGKNISVNYPSSTIKERLPDGENITFVNMIFSNLGDYLTVRNNRVQTVSDILSAQVKWNQSNDFSNEPIEILFEISQEVIEYEEHNISCVFWDFSMDPSSNEAFSSWSKTGIETRSLANSSTVKCLSHHLSTFAVIAENTTTEPPTAPPIVDTTEPPASFTTSTMPPTTSPTTAKTTSPSTEPPTTKPTECCCNEEVQRYRGFDVTWNTTVKGETVVTDCKGDGLTGNVTRTCGYDNQWQPAKIYCIREQINKIFTEITNLTESFSNLTATEQINKTDSIIETLVNITGPDTESQYPQELSAAVDVISSINNFTNKVVDMRQPNDTFFDEATQVFDNLLSPSNEEGWKELQEISSDANQKLVQNAEQFGQLLAQTLSEDVPETIKTKQNIVIKAEIATADVIEKLDGKPLKFPDDDDREQIEGTFDGLNAQIAIPAELLSEALEASNGTKLPVVNTVFRNLASVLPSVSSNEAATRPVSAVLSSQLSDTKRFTTSIPIELTFAINKEEVSNDIGGDVQFEQSCGFWDFDLNINSNVSGGWSGEGVEFIEEKSTNVSAVCHSYHLTSFAVLVSVKHESEVPVETKALTIISYIGCSISIVCLLLSVAILSFFMLKKILKGTHVFVHLNLCIALLLGNLVFVSGIDTATNNRGACIFVAVLLQYFFTSAFCWMLCEGVILYMLLVIVFNSRLNRRLFFAALGWGTAIPIVAISVGIAHNQYGVDYCWISTEKGAIAAFIAPMVVIILINCVFLGFALRALYSSKTRKMKSGEVANKEIAKHLIKATIVLLPLLGLTWLIGIVSVNNDTTAFAWIFTILNSLQGVLILFFHVLRNQEVKKHITTLQSKAHSRLLRLSSSSSSKYSSSPTHTSYASNVRKQSAQSDTFNYNQPKTPISPCDSSVFSEGFLSTTLDRKGKRGQSNPSEFSVRLSSSTDDCKEHQIGSENKSGETDASKIDTILEMTEIKEKDITKDLENVSEAETIKDDFEGIGHFNDDTEIEAVNTINAIKIEETLEESEV